EAHRPQPENDGSHVVIEMEDEHTTEGSSAQEAPVTQQHPWYECLLPRCYRTRQNYSLFVFAPGNRFRIWCQRISSSVLFDYVILVLIGLSCIALAMERPSLQPESTERFILTILDLVFAGLFFVEMIIKVVSLGLVLGKDSYIHISWNLIEPVVSLGLVLGKDSYARNAGTSWTGCW
ncbi:hypothetical protein WMY93_031621, partial [Mugilogobius chulae]